MSQSKFERWMNRTRWLFRLTFVLVMPTPDKWPGLSKITVEHVAWSKRTARIETSAWLGISKPYWKLSKAVRIRKVPAPKKTYPGSDLLRRVKLKDLTIV